MQNPMKGDETTMRTYVVPDASDASAEDLDPGTYNATIQAVDPQPGDPEAEEEWKKKDQLKVVYRLTDLCRDDGSDITRWQYMTDVGSLDPRSNLYGLMSAILFDGKEIPPGQSVSLDDLIDKPCQIVWGSHVLQAGPNKGKTRMKIKSVLGPPRALSGSSGVRKRAPAEPQIDPDTAF